MTYTIEWIEEKTTSTNKPFRKMSLKDEAGVTTTEVSIWSDNPQYDKAILSGTLEGEITTNEKGYKNFQAPKGNLSRYGGGNPGGAVKAANVTAESVKKAQDKKETAIEISSTFRDATMITLAQFAGKEFTPQQFQAQWQQWRKWLLANFSNNDVRGEIEANNIPF